MNNLLRWVYTVCLSIAPAVAFSQDFELTLWGGSHHFHSAPQGREWNEFHPGIGIRAYLKEWRGVESFIQTDYVFQNSTGGSLAMLGGGVQLPVLVRNDTSLLVGAVLGVAWYENTWERKSYVFPGGYPYLGIRHKRTTLSVGYIPRVQRTELESSNVVFFTIGQLL